VYTRLLFLIKREREREKFCYTKWSKPGDALSPLFFNFALEYALMKVQENQVGMKLSGTHQLLAFADDVNVLGDNRDYKEKHRNFN
jgi:hypothetical protein